MGRTTCANRLPLCRVARIRQTLIVQASGARYPPIGDYGLIGDCHSAALVSRTGSIDWCCLPRFDSGSAFGRLLDWEQGGHCSITPVRQARGSTSANTSRHARARDDASRAGRRGPAARLLRREDTGTRTREPQILRMLEGVRGSVELEVRVAPRFDYGEVRPWIRRHGEARAQRDRRQRRAGRLVRWRARGGSGARASRADFRGRGRAGAAAPALPPPRS